MMRAIDAEKQHRLPANAARADGMGNFATGHSSQRGYTLIEVVVAFAILALGLTLLLGTLSGAAQQIRWADDAGRAALHAQSLLDQVGVGETLQPGQQSGEFEDGRYRWTLQVAPYRDPTAQAAPALDLSAPQLLQLSLEVRWGGEARQRLQVESLRLVQAEGAQALPLP
jgi:general secretion pathway protein I